MRVNANICNVFHFLPSCLSKWLTSASLSLFQLMFSFLLASAGSLKRLRKSEIRNVYFPLHLIAFIVLIRLCPVIFENVFMLHILVFYVLLFAWRTLISFTMSFRCFYHFLCFLLVMIFLDFTGTHFLNLSVFACSLH